MIRSCLLFFLVLLQACNGQKVENTTPTKKIDGVSLVASRDSLLPENLQPLVALGANYASIMPYSFLRGPEEPTLIYNRERQWFGETYEGTRQYIRELHAEGLEVMLKPHMWIGRGNFTGDLMLKDDESWRLFEAGYRDYVLAYAKIAEEEKAALFCIGTELFTFVKERTPFWRSLIADVRKVYSGKITYAENWDKLLEFPLTDDLDYIGVDAYFPISGSKTPTIEEARLGWQDYKKELAELSKKHNKPVLFTEYGYRSMDYAGRTPWQTDRSDGGINLEAQNNLIQALFDEFYEEPWYAGGFIWKWFPGHEDSGGAENNRFTPQNKPAEVFLKKKFKH